MSSILTNNGAMIALQTLKGINANMAKTQSEISTGKSIATAKDNAAIWAISKTMESDIEGFKGISDALGLGQSTVAVARQASETVTDLLKQMKGKIVAAQGDNVDRAKLQTDITALRDQITSVVGAAQFNGLNLLSNRERTVGTGSTNVLSSLDRSTTGVAASSIRVSKEDLGTTASVINNTTALTGAATPMSGAAATAATALTGNATTVPTTLATISGATGAANSVTAGMGFSVAITASSAALTGLNTANINSISYVARDGDTATDVANKLSEAFNRHVDNYRIANPNAAGTSTMRSAVTVDASGNATLTFTGANVANSDFSVQAQAYGPGTGATANVIGGGLAQLSNLSVDSTNNARGALRDIESLITTAVDASAAFGSAAGRIETQSKFVSGLMDSLKSGIGTLVDADMEETSARLQALQVQQQLGVQSLSIANQAPQSILSLFR